MKAGLRWVIKRVDQSEDDRIKLQHGKVEVM